jgi:hypothetical protein
MFATVWSQPLYQLGKMIADITLDKMYSLVSAFRTFQPYSLGRQQAATQVAIAK